MKFSNSRSPSSSWSREYSSISCPICLSHIGGNRSAILTTCLHAYCLDCLLKWSTYKRTCPLCNASFSSFFASPFFRIHRLPTPPPTPLPLSRPVPLQNSNSSRRRVLRRTREEISAANRRSRPVPHLRSFGRPGSVPGDVIRDRVLQWRASIYKQAVRAVPFRERNLNLNKQINNGQREKILLRIEPWIRRELQAVLQDPDPTVIIHVATSLYLSSIEKKTPVFSVCANSEDTFLSPLRPFLGEWTTLFWHELSCFAESSFSMDTYDEVVEYRNPEDC